MAKLKRLLRGIWNRQWKKVVLNINYDHMIGCINEDRNSSFHFVMNMFQYLCMCVHINHFISFLLLLSNIRCVNNSNFTFRYRISNRKVKIPLRLCILLQRGQQAFYCMQDSSIILSEIIIFNFTCQLVVESNMKLGVFVKAFCVCDQHL